MKKLSVSDYSLWSTLSSPSLNNDGTWFSYSLSYESGVDTLYLSTTKGAKIIAIPESSVGVFSGTSWFAALTESNILHLTNLKTVVVDLVAGVKKFAFTSNGNYLVLERFTENSSSLLEVRNLRTGSVYSLPDVTKWLLGPDGNAILYSSSSAKVGIVGVLYAGTTVTKKVLIEEASTTFSTLVWEKEGKAIAFLSKADSSLKKSLFLYAFSTGLLKKLEGTDERLPAERSIVSSSFNYITISPDCKRVVFPTTADIVADVTLDAPQIWNTTDRATYPYRKINGGSAALVHNYLWDVERDTVQQVNDEVFSQVLFDANLTYAITSDYHAYEPQPKMTVDRDYYCTDLLTGTKGLLLKQFSGREQDLLFSPDGLYLTYFKDKNWWVYDLVKKAHVNCTASITTPLYDVLHDDGGALLYYDFAGWNRDGGSFVVYDTNDLWQVFPTGKNPIRLTDGASKNLVYRLSEQDNSQKLQRNYSGFTAGVLDLTSDLLLTMRSSDYLTNGFGILKNNKTVVILFYEKTGVSHLKKAANHDRLIFMEQSYAISPRLVFHEAGKKERILFSSNPQQQKYHWGLAKRITYVSPRGKLLYGTLYFPADYDPSILYPMVVHVYELFSNHFYDYQNPSVYSPEGFAITNLITRGYFVLLPDISYTRGDPGISATKSVLAAVNEALQSGSVDSKRIGLIGHSFGGYETNFIVTQTSLFACAVSGAGVSDFTSYYLYSGLNLGKPDFWRFENQQFRMGKSLFEDVEGYHRNSPVLHASKITTPLLSWTGADDTQIIATQSEEFYNALRRLGKRHILLVYPDEFHALNMPFHQIDLTTRIQDWFDYYLKGDNPAAWLVDEGAR